MGGAVKAVVEVVVVVAGAVVGLARSCVPLCVFIGLLGVGGEELLVAVCPPSVRAGDVLGVESFAIACTVAGTAGVSLGRRK